MLDFIFSIYDNIAACFSRNISPYQLITTFWFLFFVEFPRYYLLDIIVVIWQNLTFRQHVLDKIVAKTKLNIEKPLVTILVPGKNEGKHIYKLVMSLQEQTYKNYEIIIVDDGSDDATPLICSDFEKLGLIDKYLRLGLRGGKASAANYGMVYAKGKYIVHLDADSSLDYNAIENILLPFYINPKIKGVGGCIKVRNASDSLCSSLQAIEYLKTIMVGRMVTSTLGIYHIISGAFGAFDAATLKEIGYWDIGPGLDGDITQKLRKAGHKVCFAHDAICYTNVPNKWYNLFKQRLRWSKSLVRFRVRKHKDILLPNKNFSWLNYLSNLECIVFEGVFNYIWFFYIIGLILGNTDRLLEIMIMGWLIRISFSFIAFGTIMLITERRREEFGLIRYLFLVTFYNGYFLRITRLFAHTMEFFMFSSYKDSWNPQKTSSVAQYESV